MVNYSENDTVQIISDQYGVPRGTVGTVVMVFTKPNEAYEVEITDRHGKTVTFCTVRPEDLTK